MKKYTYVIFALLVSVSCSHTFEDRTGTVVEKQFVPAISGIGYGVAFNGKFSVVSYHEREKYIVFVQDGNAVDPHEVSKDEFFTYQKGDIVHYKREKK